MSVRNGSPPWPALSDLIVSTYQRFVGHSLLPADIPETEHASWLNEEAPFCVLAHNADVDPRFVYANTAAQRCIEYSWEEFLALPSYRSAGVLAEAERKRLLDAVSRDRFACGYRGLRAAKSGRRFWIEAGIFWQVIGARGEVYGRAVTFPPWRDAWFRSPAI